MKMEIKHFFNAKLKWWYFLVFLVKKILSNRGINQRIWSCNLKNTIMYIITLLRKNYLILLGFNWLIRFCWFLNILSTFMFPMEPFPSFYDSFADKFDSWLFNSKLNPIFQYPRIVVWNSLKHTECYWNRQSIYHIFALCLMHTFYILRN